MNRMFKVYVAIPSLVLSLIGCVPDTSGSASQASNSTPLQNQSGGGTGTIPTLPNPTNPTLPGDDDGYIDPNENGGSDSGYVAPLNFLFCGETGQIVLQKGQRTKLTWAYPDGYVPSQALQMSLESTPAGISNMGTLTPDTVLSVWYEAPATIPIEFTVKVRAVLSDSTTPAVCQVHLIADTSLGIVDDGTSRGAVGNVYELPANTPRLPDFSTMTPLSQILMPNFDVPSRSFSEGFPGVPDLFEWFGIRFVGRIVLPEAGTYQFRMTSDDGAIFSIDNSIVVNNDGVHAPQTVTSNATLTAGTHTFRLDYFQGPRYLIALQLYWKKPSGSAFEIIPPDSLLRPAP